jgi:hypothetical protein
MGWVATTSTPKSAMSATMTSPIATGAGTRTPHRVR